MNNNSISPSRRGLETQIWQGTHWGTRKFAPRATHQLKNKRVITTRRNSFEHRCVPLTALLAQLCAAAGGGAKNWQRTPFWTKSGPEHC